MSRWKHFKASEFECRCGCGKNEMSFEVIDKLDIMRSQLGFPLIVSSGYRCPQHNLKVSTTGLNGPHTTGRSADLAAHSSQALSIVRLALSRFSGIGVNQRGQYDKRFIHLDDLDSEGIRSRPHIWTY